MKRSKWIAVVLAAMLFAGCGSGGGDGEVDGGLNPGPGGGDGGGNGGGGGGGDNTVGGSLGTLSDIGDFWSNNQNTGFDYYFTSTLDINSRNEILGYTNGARNPFVRDALTGIMTMIPGRGGKTYDDYYELKETPSTNVFDATRVLKINDSSLVLGNSFSFENLDNIRAYVYNYNTHDLIDLAPISYYDNDGKRVFKEYTEAADINQAGWVLLTAENSLGKRYCYLWDGVTTHTISDLEREDESLVPPFAVPTYIPGGSVESADSLAVAINDNLVNGRYQYVCNSNDTAFVFDGFDGVVINNLPGNTGPLKAVAMNNAFPVGHVVGQAGDKGFFWDGGETHPISNPSGAAVTIVGINNNDKVIGNSDGRAFIWWLDAQGKGVFQSLGTLGGATSTAVAINDNDIVIGYSETGKKYDVENVRVNVVHAFAWRDSVMYDLGTHVPPFDYPNKPNFPFSMGRAINNSNVIVGDSYTINSHHRGFILTPTFP